MEEGDTVARGEILARLDDRDELLSVRDAERPQSQEQRVGAACATHHVGHAAIRCDIVLELLDVGACCGFVFDPPINP